MVRRSSLSVKSASTHNPLRQSVRYGTINDALFCFAVKTSAGCRRLALNLEFHFTYLHVWTVTWIVARSKTVSQSVEAGRQT